MVEAAEKLAVEGLTISYGSDVVLRGIDLKVQEHEVFGIIGPAGSGKTTFLRSLNRMNEFDHDMHVSTGGIFKKSRTYTLSGKELALYFPYRWVFLSRYTKTLHSRLASLAFVREGN